MQRYSSLVLTQTLLALLLSQSFYSQECLIGNDFTFTFNSSSAAQQYIQRTAKQVTNQKLMATFGTLIKTLGSGSFGDVKQYKTSQGKDIAVKLIKKDPNLGTYDYKLLFLEVNANACLYNYLREDEAVKSPPELAVMNGVFYDSNFRNYSFVFNYYSSDLGKYHKKYLKKRYNEYSAQDQKVLVMIMYKLAQQIGYMHDKGFVHRDLKLENILMEGSVPILADFGMSSPQLKAFYDQVGTPYYMDPILVSKSQGSSKSDIYSLGIIYYLLLNGYSSFQTLDNMVVQGGFTGNHALYRPRVAMLKFPTGFTELADMVSLTPASRPNMNSVITYLKGKLQEFEEQQKPVFLKEMNQNNQMQYQRAKTPVDYYNTPAQNRKTPAQNYTPVQQKYTPAQRGNTPVDINNTPVNYRHTPVQNEKPKAQAIQGTMNADELYFMEEMRKKQAQIKEMEQKAYAQNKYQSPTPAQRQTPIHQMGMKNHQAAAQYQMVNQNGMGQKPPLKGMIHPGLYNENPPQLNLNPDRLNHVQRAQEPDFHFQPTEGLDKPITMFAAIRNEAQRNREKNTKQNLNLFYI